MATVNYPTYPDPANTVAVITGGSRGIGAAREKKYLCDPCEEARFCCMQSAALSLDQCTPKTSSSIAVPASADD